MYAVAVVPIKQVQSVSVSIGGGRRETGHQNYEVKKT